MTRNRDAKYAVHSQAGRIRLGNMVDPKYTMGARLGPEKIPGPDLSATVWQRARHEGQFRNSYKARRSSLSPARVVFSLDRLGAEDAINVASIHDLSGGLDIYGKPMADALTLAVEETRVVNAGGGPLGRQIKLINYDNVAEHAQLYTQFAQQAALSPSDKVAAVHGGGIHRVARGHPARA